MILVTHAFSRRNAGDGLLVDLTLARLRAAGVASSACTVLALDAGSFHDLPSVRQVPGEPWRKASLRLIPAAGQLGASGAYLATGGRLAMGGLADLARGADAFVAVGGGYLRAGTVVEKGGVLVNHVPQLMLAAAVPHRPSVYLPQSVGPLRGTTGRLLGSLLNRIGVLYVRDDTSRREVRGMASCRRAPDLAVLHVADSWTGTPRGGAGDEVVLVARDLAGDPGNTSRLRALARGLGPHRWAVQSDALSAKSDARFYDRLGVRHTGTLTDALAETPDAVVISVRLHGALQAILAGHPAIHLSYQRKGWGAYRDLGLEEYVHDARTFNPPTVLAQAEELRARPQIFWERVEEVIPALQDASTRLTRELRDMLA